MHPTMVLECPPFGSVADGLPANEAALERFFGSFPDDHVELDGHASLASLCAQSGVSTDAVRDRLFNGTPR